MDVCYIRKLGKLHGKCRNYTVHNSFNSTYNNAIQELNKEFDRRIMKILFKTYERNVSDIDIVKELRDTCLCYNESGKIMMQWEETEKKKLQWMKVNVSFSIRKERKIQNEFDQFGSELVKLFFYIDTFKHSVCAGLSATLSEIHTLENEEWLTKYNERQRYFEQLKLHLYYVIIPIMSVIFVVGIVGNSITVLVFFKHKDLQTWSNMLIIHLAIVDIINLLLSIPISFAFHVIYLQTTIILKTPVCKFMNFPISVCLNLSVYSIASLSVFRFCVTCKSSPFFTKYKISVRKIAFLNIFCTWFMGVLTGIPYIMVNERNSEETCECVKNCRVMYSLHTVLSYILPLIIILICYFYVIRSLRESAKNMPGDKMATRSQRKARQRSARVFIVLTTCYVFSFVPFTIYALMNEMGLVPVNNSLMFHLIHDNLFICLYFGPAVNPIALCVVVNCSDNI